MWRAVLLAWLFQAGGQCASPFDTVKQLALRSPAQALTLIPSLERPGDRDLLRRLALLQATAIDPATAAREAQPDSAWFGEVLFADALRMATHLDETTANRLLMASAASHPDTVLQNWPLLRSSPQAPAVLAMAAKRAPDAAVELMAGGSPDALGLREAFATIQDERLAKLLAISQRTELPVSLRIRLAFLDTANAGDAIAYFHELANARLGEADAETIAPLDRGLERIATELAQTSQQSKLPELARLPPRDLYLTLAYARAGDEDTYFARWFDALAARQPDWPALLAGAHFLRWREFVDYSLWFRRYRRLMAQNAPAAGAAMLLHLVEGLDIPGALTTADALEESSPAVRTMFARALPRIMPQSPEQTAVRRALIERLQHRSAVPPRLAAAISGTNGVVLERYFFYDDADGVESFDSFRSHYQQAAGWTWEQHQGWVRVISTGGARRVEIAANIPVDANSPRNSLDEAARLTRRQAVDAYLDGREPAIVVHRGHAYHAPKSIEQLTRSARLVFLGSCRGLKEIRAVIEAAPQADIISTRAVGTMRVNDPLLKALNEAIRRGGTVTWPAFWATLQPRFAGNRDFAGYLPPHRNGAAAFMRLYDRYR
jgi:hypothetical protein